MQYSSVMDRQMDTYKQTDAQAMVKTLSRVKIDGAEHGRQSIGD